MTDADLRASRLAKLRGLMAKTVENGCTEAKVRREAEAEAEAERARLFPEFATDECDVVCEDCWQRFYAEHPELVKEH